MKYVVYMAVCSVTRDAYIGMTGKGLPYRKARHLQLARNGERDCPRFYDALRKYGGDSFVWCELWSGKHRADCEAQERHFIAFFRPRYNVDIGGRGGAIGRTPYNRKSVLCLSDGVLFESATAAAKAYDVNNSDISEACRGTKMRVTAAGKFFIYSDILLSRERCNSLIENIKASVVMKRRRRVGSIKHAPRQSVDGRDRLGRSAAGPLKNMRPVKCLDDGRVFSCAGEAAVFYDIALTSIRELCLGSRGRRTAGGKRFIFSEKPNGLR